MSKTLLAILAHSGAQEAIHRHWTYWMGSRADILGVGRIPHFGQRPVYWPTGVSFTMVSGVESYASGANHLVRLLPVEGRRLR